MKTVIARLEHCHSVEMVITFETLETDLTALRFRESRHGQFAHPSNISHNFVKFDSSLDPLFAVCIRRDILLLINEE